MQYRTSNTEQRHLLEMWRKLVTSEAVLGLLTDTFWLCFLKRFRVRLRLYLCDPLLSCGKFVKILEEFKNYLENC